MNAAYPVNTCAWLSNGRYRVFVTPRGTGFSACGDYFLTAWEADPVEDVDGFTVVLRDVASQNCWTACGAPLPGQDAGLASAESAGHVVQRMNAGIASRVETALAAVGDGEWRHLDLHNTGDTPRRIEVTSALAAVLNHGPAHAAHPAFSKLFVQTAFDPARGALLARRRPRANAERHPVLVHALVGHAVDAWESDRARFLGRGRGLAQAQALSGGEPLSGTVGSVLDPLLALRTIVDLPAGGRLALRFFIGCADDSAAASALLDQAAADASAANPSESLDALLQGPRGEFWRQMTAGFASASGAAVAWSSAPSPNGGGNGNGKGAEPLVADNGLGGFTADGNEYVVRLRRDGAGSLRLPPMPWANVIANPRCGVLVSERGAMTTWARNSREHKLTPWRNDPLRDPHDDALYIRDELDGRFWSPLPGPCTPRGDFEVRHGFGYSTWRHEAMGLWHETTVFVPVGDPLRIVRLRIENRGKTPRRLAVYGYQRWVLGVLPEQTRWHVATTFAHDAVLARNPAAGPFADGVAFSAMVAPASAETSWSADRASFVGAGGSPAAPAALVGGGMLDGRHSVTAQPCAAWRGAIDVAGGGFVEVDFLLGEAPSDEEAAALLRRYREPDAVRQALDEVRAFWARLLGRVRINTPVPALDLMGNGWLAYQNLSCRLWARTAYYQSGGAYGFRDQLQDAAALIALRPDLTRAQIIANAAHQFVEGDVLHWWHPPAGSGMRTRFADDLLWLPYLTAHYIAVTGDAAVLDEPVRFISARPLADDEEEVYLTPTDSGARADVYDHCCRALDRSLVTGPHGLPYFGCGDWNDGMNRVGHGGGESVWMGFFLVAIIDAFAPLCDRRGDDARAARYRAFRQQMLATLNDAGWDGEWYRRAYYADGTPLGSRQSDECRIDALAQAWAVISRAAPDDRRDAALDALERHLISDSDGLIRLLAPPFVDTPHDPGYIKGYVAGVRENGGQYTHAALWVVKAMAEAGRRDRAAEVLTMLSPVSHAATPEGVARYQTEPYVIAADVYGVAPHVGRGGWTWYTGSAGWMYRVLLETLLGFSIEGGGSLLLRPRIPDAWPGCALSYHYTPTTVYEIEMINPRGKAERVESARLDGTPVSIGNGHACVRVPLVDDGRVHRLVLMLGAAG